jgi:hypothetical protein
MDGGGKSDRSFRHSFMIYSTIAGIFSGLLTAIVMWPAGRVGGYFLGVVFGVIMAVWLGAFRMLRKLWFAIYLATAGIVAFLAAWFVAAFVDFGLISAKLTSDISAIGMFAGGMVGAFIIFITVLMLDRRQIQISARLWRSLLWSIWGGVLAATGWALGPTVGIFIWSGFHSLRLSFVGETFSAGQGRLFSLFVVWQAGIAFSLAVLLNSREPTN